MGTPRGHGRLQRGRGACKHRVRATCTSISVSVPRRQSYYLSCSGSFVVRTFEIQKVHTVMCGAVRRSLRAPAARWQPVCECVADATA